MKEKIGGWGEQGKKLSSWAIQSCAVISRQLLRHVCSACNLTRPSQVRYECAALQQQRPGSSCACVITTSTIRRYFNVFLETLYELETTNTHKSDRRLISSGSGYISGVLFPTTRAPNTRSGFNVTIILISS